MGTTGLFCGDVLGTTLVLESNEGVRRFTEESTESSELENQVALLDAKLNEVRGTGSKLDAKTDDELLQVDVMATEVELGGEPLFDDEGSGLDGDRDFSSDDLDGVDVMIEIVCIHNNPRLLSRNSNQYENEKTKMWDVGGDAFDSMRDVGFLEFAELSLNEPKLENELVTENVDNA
ncbi:hypothetical protein GmHk_12G034369 [Glycine max]|nr:hypothetical protein GmHk_12G034369 [Glycine max]